jgi:site-specific recombinase XerD
LNVVFFSFSDIREFLETTIISPPGAANDYGKEMNEGMQLVFEAKAKQTNRAYLSALAGFHTWATSRNVSDLPAKPQTVLAYLGYLKKRDLSKSFFGILQSAISWAHQAACLSSPITPTVRLAFQGASRCCRPPVKTSAFPLRHFRSCLCWLTSHPSVLHDRLAVLIIFLYYGFLRIGEALKLTKSDVIIEGDCIKLFIATSKTDKGSQGASILIAKGSGTCSPGKVLAKYLSTMSKFSTWSNRSPFLPSFSGSRCTDRPLTYDNARKAFQNLLSAARIPTSYGLHSLRAGGTSEASNSGVPAELIRQHGRWSSSSATMVNSYLQPSKNRQLLVTQKIQEH